MSNMAPGFTPVASTSALSSAMPGIFESTGHRGETLTSTPPKSAGTAALSTPQRKTILVRPEGLEERLFDSRSLAKRTTASLSMHLTPEWRKKLFSQLDAILDVEEWDSNDLLPNQEAVRTFLRYVIYAGIKTSPSLGISNAGNLIAGWHQSGRKVSIEFLPEDKCRLILADLDGADRSVITFAGTVIKARDFLSGQFSIA